MNKRYQMVLLAIVICAALALILEAGVTEDEWKEVQKVFNDSYAKAKTGPERTAAIQKLIAADHPGVVKVMVNTVFPKETKEDDPIIMDVITTAMSKLTDLDAIQEAITATKKAGGPTKIILMRVIGRFDVAEAKNVLMECLSNSDNIVKMTAIDALSASTPPEALPKVLEALNAKSWELKASAINYLSNVKDEEGKKKALEVLRTMRPKETGRFRNDISVAINKLAEATMAGDEKDNKTYAFFDIPLEGDVIFVIDLSLSMKVGKTKEGPTRVEVLIRELKKSIDMMAQIKPPVKFNIIGYSEKVQKWQKTLVPITTDYKNQAMAWIEGLDKNMGQFTNIYDALELALAGDSSEGRKVVTTGGSGVATPYTICFMTDGKANRGKYINIEEILAAVRSLNKSRKIRINALTLGVGAADGGGMGGGGMGGGGGGGPPPSALVPDAELMKRLAEENNGVYKEF